MSHTIIFVAIFFLYSVAPVFSFPFDFDPQQPLLLPSKALNSPILAQELEGSSDMPLLENGLRFLSVRTPSSYLFVRLTFPSAVRKREAPLSVEAGDHHPLKQHQTSGGSSINFSPKQENERRSVQNTRVSWAEMSSADDCSSVLPLDERVRCLEFVISLLEDENAKSQTQSKILLELTCLLVAIILAILSIVVLKASCSYASTSLQKARKPVHYILTEEGHAGPADVTTQAAQLAAASSDLTAYQIVSYPELAV